MADSRPSRSASALSPCRQVFVDEYLTDLNATRAYRVAYPRASLKAAESGASRLLRDAKVAAAVTRAMQQRAERVELEQDEVLQVLKDLLRSDVRDFQMDPVTGTLTLRHGATEHAWKAVSSVKHRTITRRTAEKETETEHTVEFRLWSKPDVARLAMQHLGMLTQKHEVTGKNGGPIGPAVHFYLPENGRDLTPEDRARRIEALLDVARRRAQAAGGPNGTGTNGGGHAA